MKISEAWLREWVSPEKNTQEIGDQLTMLGLEVDAIYPAAGKFDKIIVAKVSDTCKHPQADRLTLCTVNDGTSEFQVVCGAANVRPGLMVALATCGAVLPNGMKIKKSKLRGEVSNGMLCSVEELGLDDKSSGIMELAEDAPLGMDLREYLQLDDNIFDIDLTPNRADCFSMLGVAREIATKNNLQLNTPVFNDTQESIQDTLSINLHDKASCPKYAGRIIRGINTHAKTPVWMQEKLRRAGVRVLHPVVDILNYVMMELGQPMHAFDLNVIKGAIQVRPANTSEKLTLLNGQEVALQEDCLVIADDEKAIALAGIMGGESSAVNDATTDVFLESAFFTPAKLANKARRFGLSSDASMRYERGVDPELVEKAMQRATALIVAIVGGEVGPISTQVYAENVPSPTTISFAPSKVKRLIGIDIPESEMQTTLQNLGMQVTKQADSWHVTPPTYRFDMSLEVDLVEEVARVYGFDQIAANMPHAEAKAGRISEYEQAAMSAAEHFANRGYHETISYSFVDPEVQELLYPGVIAKKLVNPISPELAVMRVGMWPGLIASMIHNMHRQQSGVKFIETGVVFKPSKDGYQEESVISGLISGRYGELNWSEVSGKYDFYDLKGDLEALFTKFALKNIEFVKTEHAALHPGKSAQILLAGEPIGVIGVLHPSLLDALDLNDEVVMFEMSLKALLRSERRLYQTVSKYPQTRRDLSLLVPKEVCVADLQKVVVNVVPDNFLKDFDIFDVYIGKNIPSDKKSVALSLLLQDDNATLVDEKINEIMDLVLSALISEHNVTLRSIDE